MIKIGSEVLEKHIYLYFLTYVIISMVKIKIKGTVYLGKLRYFINEDVLSLFFSIKHMISRPKAQKKTICETKFAFRQITLSFHNLAKVF